MANNMGVPEEKLLDVLYKAEAARKAEEQVKKALREQEKLDAAAAAEAAADGTGD